MCLEPKGKDKLSPVEENQSKIEGCKVKGSKLQEYVIISNVQLHNVWLHATGSKGWDKEGNHFS